MSEETTAREPDGESTKQRSDWASDAEVALEGVGNALREAWEASREARLSALESAKKAALQLGEAIDHGVAAAREKWESQGGTPEEPSEEGPPEGTEHTAPQMSPDEGRDEQQ